ncbi:MAG: hypothetical protein HC917_24930, partial [Richelia sp. SM2_1_7]|nr:hypothetical protein [Richelia sp. SM2_1_7]
MIEAREGYVLGISDLSGAELRLAADYSKDRVLVDNFNAGGDFHSELASCSWRIMTKDDTPISKKYHPEFRDKHKQVNFGIIYGATHTRIAEVLGIELDMAKQCFEEIKQKVPVLMNYLKKNQIKAKNNGFLIGKLGRIAYKLNATQAANFEIQNANAEAMKIALRKIYNYIKLHNLDAYI